MKFPGGNDLYSRSVWFENRAVRVSSPKLKAEGGPPEKAGRSSAKISMPQLQLLGDRLVTGQIRVLQIFKQAAALADHDQQPAARAVNLIVRLQMFGQMIDPLRQQRDLHIRRPRVTVVQLELFNCFCLQFHISKAPEFNGPHPGCKEFSFR
jgi:hypothetical protein